MLSRGLTRLYLNSFRNILPSSCGFCLSSNKEEQWRKPWKDRSGEWYSNLSVFQFPGGPNPEWLTFVQTDIDLRPSSIKRWWKRSKEKQIIFEERYIPERHKILGGDLAAAHFLVHRGGAVRFYDNPKWIRKNEDDEYNLPKFFDPAYIIEAIDASKMVIHFEGLGNLMDIFKVKWISFEGCPNIDDWCLDRVSGAYLNCLEYLDIRNCPKVTVRGLAALYRMRKLKKLLISNEAQDKNVELACLMLEDVMPQLEIEGVTYMELPNSTKDSPKEERESQRA